MLGQSQLVPVLDDTASYSRHPLLSQVTLSAAQSHYRETQKSPFQHLPWQTGCLHFKYLQVCTQKT